MSDLIDVTTQRISPTQMRWLGENFGLVGLRRLDPLLRYTYEHRNLLAAGGAEVCTDALALLRGLFYVQQNVRLDRPARIRIVRDNSTQSRPPIIRFRVELFDPADQQWKVSTIQDLSQR